MDIEYEKTGRGKVARIWAFPKQWAAITVSKESAFGSTVYSPAVVNWSAIGNQSADTAYAYGVALVRAAQIADNFDRELK